MQKKYLDKIESFLWTNFEICELKYRYLVLRLAKVRETKQVFYFQNTSKYQGVFINRLGGYPHCAASQSQVRQLCEQNYNNNYVDIGKI